MRPIILTILDGWGYSSKKIGNAIANARTPNMGFISANYPSLLLQASGQSVGLTWGEAGNSEVGHLTIGAGRSVFQYLTRINKAIENGEFFNNKALIRAINHVKENKSKFHILGLLTSGSVHAYFDHLINLLYLANKNNLTDVKLHLFTDGKDSGLKESINLLDKLNDYLKKYSNVSIATIIGRNFSMDRNKNWDLTEKAYRLFTRGEGEKADNPIKKISEYHSQGLHDNNIPPIIFDNDGTIGDGDSVIFFNFREDSMGQIVRSFTDDGIEFFSRDKVSDLIIVGMTKYFESPNLLAAFPMPEIKNSLAEVLSIYQKKQLHIAETEKYAHVTYFFNCLQDKAFTGETDILIKSARDPKDNPEMMAYEITAKAIESINQDAYDFLLINFANADFVAHTGSLDKTVRGVEVVDSCVGKLKDSVFAKNGILIITSDHGNAESLTYKGGEEETRHNMNPVPFYMVVKEYERPRSEDEIRQTMSGAKGIIADIAPTILEILGISKPEEMTGTSLFNLL